MHGFLEHCWHGGVHGPAGIEDFHKPVHVLKQMDIMIETERIDPQQFFKLTRVGAVDRHIGNSSEDILVFALGRLNDKKGDPVTASELIDDLVYRIALSRPCGAGDKGMQGERVAVQIHLGFRGATHAVHLAKLKVLPLAGAAVTERLLAEIGMLDYRKAADGLSWQPHQNCQFIAAHKHGGGNRGGDAATPVGEDRMQQAGEIVVHGGQGGVVPAPEIDGRKFQAGFFSPHEGPVCARGHFGCFPAVGKEVGGTFPHALAFALLNPFQLAVNTVKNILYNLVLVCKEHALRGALRDAVCFRLLCARAPGCCFACAFGVPARDSRGGGACLRFRIGLGRDAAEYGIACYNPARRSQTHPSC